MNYAREVQEIKDAGIKLARIIDAQGGTGMTESEKRLMEIALDAVEIAMKLGIQCVQRDK